MNALIYEQYKKLWIINGCGGKWWLNFSKILHHQIVLFPEFQKEKLQKLLYDIEHKACWPHDVHFYQWWLLIAYIISNFLFGYRLFKLLHWTTFGKRLLIGLSAFFGLLFWGYKYFHWCLPWKKNKINL